VRVGQDGMKRTKNPGHRAEGRVPGALPGNGRGFKGTRKREEVVET